MGGVIKELEPGGQFPDLHLPDNAGGPDNCPSLPARIRWCCTSSAAAASTGAIFERFLDTARPS